MAVVVNPANCGLREFPGGLLMLSSVISGWSPDARYVINFQFMRSRICTLVISQYLKAR